MSEFKLDDILNRKGRLMEFKSWPDHWKDSITEKECESLSGVRTRKLFLAMQEVDWPFEDKEFEEFLKYSEYAFLYGVAGDDD